MRARVVCLCLLVALVCMAGCAARVERLPTPTGRNLGPGLQTPPPVNGTPQPALLEQRMLVLEWPKTLRERDSDLITLSIFMDEQGNITPTVAQTSGGTRITIPNIYDTHNITAVARLDMAGMDTYRDEIHEPLRAGQPLTIQWSVRASEAAVYRGVVWLSLELVPKNGGPIDEMLLLSRPIEIQVVTVFGLPGTWARVLGGVGLFASAILGYPFIEHRIEEWLKRRKRKNIRPPSQPEEVQPPKNQI